MLRRLGAREDHIHAVQGNIANTYQMLGRYEEALPLRRDVYSECVKFNGEEHNNTLRAANNYAISLNNLQRFVEARSLLLKTMPVTRRVLGESNDVTLRLGWTYAISLYKDPDATLDDLREAVTTLEDATRIARRVLGTAHPVAQGIGCCLEESRATLRAARETPASA